MQHKEKLESAYREHGKRMRSWLASKTDDDQAQDILHDVFARAFANLDAMEPVRDIAAWLWRMAANALRDSWRKARVRRAIDSGSRGELDDIVAGALYDHAGETERADILAALHASIRSLPEDQRTVVEANCLQGESVPSISARTGIPIDTLNSRKRYALAKLRKSMQDFF